MDTGEHMLQAVSDLERLAVLESTALLDSPAEKSFDRITDLASAILEAPVSLVSLVDKNRQFFKSAAGLPEPWASRRETPLSHSFCKHVVSTAEPLVITDARSHPDLKDNMAVPNLGVIAYLGIPLTTHQGRTLGSFCVIDIKPREWTEREIGILKDLTAIVMEKIQLRILARRLQSDYLEMRRSHLYNDEMIHMLVHDLRSPLSSFLGGIDIAVEEGGLTKEQESYLSLSREGGEMLLRMISSILDDSKAEAGQIRIKKATVRPQEIIASVEKQLTPLSEKYEVQLGHDTSDASFIMADGELLRRVLVNLVSNAIQHTPSGGKVTLFAVTDEGSSCVKFTVSDTGGGIPQEAHGLIFEKFGWVNTKRISGSSTGLGLPFSRSVIEAHGGSIWLESDIGRGTRFYFTIPILSTSPTYE